MNPLFYDIRTTPRAMNVISRAKTRFLQKRPGRTLLSSVSASDGAALGLWSVVYEDSGGTAILPDAFEVTTTTLEGNGIKDFKPVLSTRKLVAKIGTSLYKMDDLDGTLDSLKSGLLNSPASFEVYTVARVVYVIFVSDAAEAPLRWNGTDATTRLFGSGTSQSSPGTYTDSDTDTATPFAGAVKVWRNRCWFGRITGKQYEIQWTDANSFTVGSSNNLTLDVPTKDDGVMGFGELRNVMYVFTPYCILRVSYLGGNPLVDVKPAVIGVGCTAVRTIQNIVYGGKEVLAFLGTDKRVYAFDGYSTMPISTAIDEDNEFSPISMATLNGGGVQLAHATKDDTKQLYSLYVPNLGTSRMTHRLVFDYSGEGAWWAWDNQDMKCSSSVYDALGRQRHVAINYAGKVFFMDEGTTDDGTAISGEWVSHKLTSQIPDMVKASTLDFVTKRLGDYRIKGSYRTEFADDFSTESGTNGDIALSTSGDSFLGSTLTLGTSELGGPAAVQSSIDLPQTFSRLEIRVRDNPDSIISADPWSLLEIIPQGVTLAAAYGADNAST